MSDKMRGLAFRELMKGVIDRERGFFGIYPEFQALPDRSLAVSRYGRTLDVPLGVAAGPHTQLSHNIVAAYLCGARFFELKTVQVLDSIEVDKPCIDMEDEGFNCEWSQELDLTASFHEYCNAWIALHFIASQNGRDLSDPGFEFNISVGYDMKGIKGAKIQEFLRRMSDAGDFIAAKVKGAADICPELAGLRVPSRLAGSVTLSTMHGCPADEIESIAAYLMEEKGLSAYVKLNPTLIGSRRLREILNKKLGYEVKVSAKAFKHDLGMDKALELIERLGKTAGKAGTKFGVKLTNTLESLYPRKLFPKSVSTAYMSGRALHPISVGTAAELQTAMKGELDISFAGGADCFNIGPLLECGLTPVTVCSDLLKPGGYGRLPQYLSELQNYFKGGALQSFLAGLKPEDKVRKLKDYAAQTAESPYYKKDRSAASGKKQTRKLPVFDCAIAPCEASCPAGQNVSEYIAQIENNDLRGALKTVYKDNPFPALTGMVCEHVCQFKCVRRNFDHAVNIRHLKRFILENAETIPVPEIKEIGKKVAIVGGGPAGLSCAWYSRLNGFSVKIFESGPGPGGLAASVIPDFRITGDQLEQDIKRILDSGVEFLRDTKIDKNQLESLIEEYDAVFLAAGAGEDKKLGIPGENEKGVFRALDFLSAVKNQNFPEIGGEVCVIGGGNSAMDAARAALRLAGKNAGVRIVYRRTISEMPADREELEQIIEEGAEILELLSPKKIECRGGRLVLTCDKMRLGRKDKSGRRSPVSDKGKAEEINADSVIVAIGQGSDDDLWSAFPKGGDFGGKLFFGGDYLRGPANIISAIADGKKAAEIISKSVSGASDKTGFYKTAGEWASRISKRVFEQAPKFLPPDKRRDFSQVIFSYTAEQAALEAKRCLHCSEICNACVTACPNRALVAAESEDVSAPVYVFSPDGGGPRIESVMKCEQKFQILHIADFCNACGNCAVFCPSADSPYKVKPRICLSAETFEREELGYFVSPKEIRYKSPDGGAILWMEENKYIYTDGCLSAEFSVEEFKALSATGSDHEMRLEGPAEMKIILDLIKNSELIRYVQI